ncbi:MAG: LysM peptidoglycan-binding domain-containing protein, partial [Rhizobacter sp.]|nr:LysM peptidoglycan-binding domain-containing protein [Rhizobacter sp.]
MKKNVVFSGRFALTSVAAAALSLTVPAVFALGLGKLAVQSALGESLRAEIDVTSISAEEASNLRVRVAPPESYRAAGVDYNPVLPGTTVVLQRRSDGRPYLRIASDRSVQEPFVDVILELSWSTGRLVREYTLLLDPPAVARAPSPAAPAAAPLISAAPVAPPQAAVPVPVRPAPPPAPALRPAAPAPVRPSAQAAAPAPRAVRPSATIDEYMVKSGDTLTSIANRNSRPGVSLDQMLVSLFRGNSQAFVDENMNRLKAGVVLTIPTTEAARSVDPGEARRDIRAQSADFRAYRQRLAGAAPVAKTEGSSRQASGKVKASVDDRKEAAAPTPDKLTLSKGSAAGKASAAEERISKEREKKDAATRVAELSKNVKELTQLTGAAAAAASKPTGAGLAVPTPAPVAAVTPPPPPPPAPPPAPAPAPPPPPPPP